MKRTRKQKKPKALRFSRYFLRGLLGCSLAAGIFAAYALNTFGDEHRTIASRTVFNYEGSRLDIGELQSYAFLGEHNALTDEEIAGRFGCDRFAIMLARITDTNRFLKYGTDLSDDQYAAMLLDPETGEYYLSKPVVGLNASGGPVYSQTGGALYLTDSAEADQIVRNFRESHLERRSRIMLSNYVSELLEKVLPFGGICYRLSDKASDLILKEADHEEFSCVSAYVKDHQCSGVSYQMPDGTLISAEKEMSAPWKLLRSDMELKADMSEEEKILWRYSDAEKLPEYLISELFTPYGLPTDAPVSKAMQAVAEWLKKELPLFQEEQQKYRDIIDDESGVKREAYYRERMEDLDDWGDADAIPTPEERLQLLNRRIKQLPENVYHCLVADAEIAEQNIWTSSSCLSADEWHTLSYGSKDITLGGKEYTLFYLLKYENAWSVYRTIIIFNCILLFVGAVLLALILALIPYLRAKRRYALDEYRRSLTASLAHDLKSPLTAISGYAENLASGVHPEKQTHYAESIQDSTRYMDSLITNVLDLAKLEQDEKTKITAVDLIALAEEHLAHHRDEIAARNMQVEILGEYTVRADQRMLSQAIQNLLDNAFKFTPDGGSIRITGDGKALCITNSIAEERIPDVERLCEAFVKGDSARSNQSGSGLGLSVVQQIARLNRMQFTVESRDHRFITTLTGGRRVRRQAEKEIWNDFKKANSITLTDITALMKQQVNAVTEQNAGILFRDVKWKITGSCMLYARLHDMENALEMLIEHALNCVPDGAEIAVEGEKRALRIVYPADRKRMSKEESDIVFNAVRTLVKKSKLCFDAEEQNGQITLKIREHMLLFRPLHFRAGGARLH